MTMQKTDTKVALVTGGTRGIGLGIAKKLAAKNFNLVITGRRSREEAQPALAEVQEHFASPNLRVEYVRADVADAVERQQLLAEVESVFGSLDVLVNNAGIAPKVRADIL